jgi:hypothetical protein
MKSGPFMYPTLVEPPGKCPRSLPAALREAAAHPALRDAPQSTKEALLQILHQYEDQNNYLCRGSLHNAESGSTCAIGAFFTGAQLDWMSRYEDDRGTLIAADVDTLVQNIGFHNFFAMTCLTVIQAKAIQKLNIQDPDVLIEAIRKVLKDGNGWIGDAYFDCRSELDYES